MTRVIAKQAIRHQYEGMATDPLKISMWTVLIQVMWLILVRDCLLLRREFQTICLSEGKFTLRIWRYLGAPKSNKIDADLSKEWDPDLESHQGKTMPPKQWHQFSPSPNSARLLWAFSFWVLKLWSVKTWNKHERGFPKLQLKVTSFKQP